jgi:hypothetical protein
MVAFNASHPKANLIITSTISWKIVAEQLFCQCLGTISNATTSGRWIFVAYYYYFY